MTASTYQVAAIAKGPSAVDERHEFLVTYEGPFHPSAAHARSSTSDSRKTFSITLPPSGTSPPRGPSYVSHDDLLACLSGKVGWPSFLLCIADHGRRGSEPHDGSDFRRHGPRGRHPLFPSHSLRNADPGIDVVHHQHPPLSLSIRPRSTLLLGGKGGFGTLLKGQSKQAGARTTLDFGACRDLSGRRLRHVNDEIKLRKWREMQASRSKRAASEGSGGGAATEEELAALRTPSGIRNWHLMVPGWSEGAASSNKGRRRIERQLEREVRGWRSKEERARMAGEERRAGEERAVMAYVRRGEEEGERVVGAGPRQDVKEGILAHLRKRREEKIASDNGSAKQRHRVGGEEATKKGGASLAARISCEKFPFSDDNIPKESTMVSSHLMTLSGEMSVCELSINKTTSSSTEQTKNAPKDQATATKLLRIQSQSDFATAVILLNPAKLQDLSSSSSRTQGVYIEYTVRSEGLAQIGWIRSPAAAGGGEEANDRDVAALFLPNSDTGDGVGDDSASFGYDGSRGLKFHDGNEVAYGGAKDIERKEENDTPAEWKAGGVLGCWCKYAAAEDGRSATTEIGYALNGVDLGTAFTIPTTATQGNDAFGYYPAASLNLDEVLDVNVGPDFAFDARDGCAGACEFVRMQPGSAACDVENVSGKSKATSKDDLEDVKESIMVEDGDDKAPPRKRQREGEPVNDRCSASDEDEETVKQGNDGDAAYNLANTEKETFDLNKCSSVEELKEMGSARLKNILLSMGVKCGGTPEERAGRLYSLKGLRREGYPNKVKGKNFIP